MSFPDSIDAPTTALTPTTTLRLDDGRGPEVEPAGPLRFERRRAPRWSAAGHATAMTTPDPTRRDDGADTTPRLCALHVTDRSAAGLGGVATGRFTEATRVTIFVPADRDTPAARLVGRVVRCLPVPGGFGVGIALESTGSAA